MCIYIYIYGDRVVMQLVVVLMVIKGGVSLLMMVDVGMVEVGTVEVIVALQGRIGDGGSRRYP
jgi:hypothetical protein